MDRNSHHKQKNSAGSHREPVTIPRIDHMVVDGEGSVTIAEIHCDGECHRLQITINKSSVWARWLD